MEKPNGPFYFSVKWDAEEDDTLTVPDGDDPIIIEILPPYKSGPHDIIDEIEDSISSYLDSIKVKSFHVLVNNVMDASGYNYRIVPNIKPIRTIHV